MDMIKVSANSRTSAVAGAMLLDGSRARLPRLLQREELRLTLLRCHRIARPQSGIDRLQVLGISANLLQGIT